MVVVLTVFAGCNKEREFSEARTLSEFEKTDFVPTIEHKISGERNFVYCVTLLYAWNEVRKKIHLPLEIPEENHDLTLLNASNSFVDALKKNEYSVIGNVDGDLITAKAELMIKE